MSLNLGWDYLEILLLFLAFGIPVVMCVAIFCWLPTSIQYPKITNYLSKMPLLYSFWNIIFIVVGFWNTSNSLCCHFLFLTFAPTNSIQKSPILCQKCLFYVNFEILLLLLLAFGIPVPVGVCGAIFCCWLLPPPTNWGQGIL